MPEYDIQPFSSVQYVLLKELFRSAFLTPLDEKAFNRKYNTKELGHEVIGFIAVHKASGTPAAFYGVFPVTVLLNGKEVLAAQSGDTMTHAKHQRKGLFQTLAGMTYDVCHKAGIQLVFGQPNKNSYHGLVNKLRFTHLDDIDYYNLKLGVKTFPFPKLFRKTNSFSFYLRFAKRILQDNIVPEPSSFVNPLNTTYGKILRNKAYLQYKQESNKFFIRLDDVIFWIKLSDVLWVGEASNYAQVTPIVLKKLKRLAFTLGYNTIRFHLNKSLGQPHFLQAFEKRDSEASCFLYLNEEFSGHNFVLTGADFDTW